jgi:hypothetical protein
MLGHQFRCIGAGSTVDFNALINGHKTKNVITGNGITTWSQFIIDLIHVIADQQGIAVGPITVNMLQKLGQRFSISASAAWRRCIGIIIAALRSFASLSRLNLFNSSS